MDVKKNYYCTAHYFETGLGQMVALAIAGSPEQCQTLLRKKLDPFFHDTITPSIEGLPNTEYLPPAVRSVAEARPGALEHVQHTHYNWS